MHLQSYINYAKYNELLSTIKKQDHNVSLFLTKYVNGYIVKTSCLPYLLSTFWLDISTFSADKQSHIIFKCIVFDVETVSFLCSN
jgi:hypothetical protein